MLVRSGKSKGNTFEYDVEYNLKKLYPTMKLLERRGFVRGLDLQDDTNKIAVECKFHKSISWNEMEDYHKKLISRIPKGYTGIVIFKTNRQPVLVYNGTNVTRFDFLFNIPFEKRPKGYTKNESKTN